MCCGRLTHAEDVRLLSNCDSIHIDGFIMKLSMLDLEAWIAEYIAYRTVLNRTPSTKT